MTEIEQHGGSPSDEKGIHDDDDEPHASDRRHRLDQFPPGSLKDIHPEQDQDGYRQEQRMGEHHHAHTRKNVVEKAYEGVKFFQSDCHVAYPFLLAERLQLRSEIFSEVDGVKPLNAISVLEGDYSCPSVREDPIHPVHPTAAGSPVKLK